MPIAPKIELRAEQPYLAITEKLTMPEIPAKLPPLIPEILSWLQEHQIEPSGPVFFNYLNMENGQLTAEVGVPVKTAQTGDSRVKAGIFPAGKYVVYTHMGNYSALPQAHMALEAWATENGIKLSDPCIEFYPTDPESEPNPENWQTDIFRGIRE
jgi:effector-binding domain-containing protein